MRIKAILAAIVGTLLAVFAIFRKGEKTGGGKVALAAETEAREYEQAMNSQLITRLEVEAREGNEPVETEKRDYFNDPL